MLIKKTYELSDFTPWSGAVSTWETIWNAGQIDDLESYLEEFYGESEIDETTLNDLLWFDGDSILTALGIDDNSEYGETAEELQGRMYDELEELIDELDSEGEIDLIGYKIARDVLWDSTENNSFITHENNIAQEFMNHRKAFVAAINTARNALVREFPDATIWDEDDLDGVSAEFIGDVYEAFTPDEENE